MARGRAMATLNRLRADYSWIETRFVVRDRLRSLSRALTWTTYVRVPRNRCRTLNLPLVSFTVRGRTVTEADEHGPREAARVGQPAADADALADAPAIAS